MKTMDAPRTIIPLTPVPPISDDTADDLTQLLKALAEPMRLKIVTIIADRRGDAVCACEFPDVLGISQPTASHHLKKLTDAGILAREQRGKWAYFTLKQQRLHALQTLLDVLDPEK